MGDKEKVEDAAENAGGAVVRGVKEGVRVAKRVGKGMKKEIDKKD
jgi:hypothetical protein